jgi:hypothetical protein
MNLLRVPVTETVTASYLIPLRTTMTVTEARQPTIKAVGDVDSLGAQQSPQRRAGDLVIVDEQDPRRLLPAGGAGCV